MKLRQGSVAGRTPAVMTKAATREAARPPSCPFVLVVEAVVIVAISASEPPVLTTGSFPTATLAASSGRLGIVRPLTSSP